MSAEQNNNANGIEPEVPVTPKPAIASLGRLWERAQEFFKTEDIDVLAARNGMTVGEVLGKGASHS